MELSGAAGHGGLRGTPERGRIHEELGIRRMAAVQKMCLAMVLTVILQFGLAEGPRSIAGTTSGSSSSATETSNSTPPPLPKSNCSCEYVTNICGESTTSAGEWVPWLSLALSILLFFVPGMRVLLTRGQLTKSNGMFWWFLCFNCMSGLAWTGYSRSCEVGQPGYPVYMTGLVGVAINLFFLLLSTETVQHVKVKGMKRAVAVVLNVMMVMAFFVLSTFGGWLGLSFGVLAHLFRMMATVYDQFNWLLFLASVGGGVNGLIWLLHPRLCIIREYKIASYIIAIIRGTEAFLWCSPWISTALWKIEEGLRNWPLNN